LRHPRCACNIKVQCKEAKNTNSLLTVIIIIIICNNIITDNKLVVFLTSLHCTFLERFQSKVLRIITDAPRYVPNAVTKRDLKVLSVGQEVRNYSDTYRHRLADHPN